jgi:tyrosine-protein kinase Etk/Wzc
MTDNKEIVNQDKNYFWQFFDILMRWRRLLLINTLIAAILTLAVMLCFPNWYAATTTILPPENDNGMLGIASSLLPSGLGSLLGGSGMSLPGLATPSDLYSSILKSRIVTKGVIDKNDLMKIYGAHLDDEAIKELQGRTSITVGAEGIIEVSYEDTNPILAAAVTNSYAEILNKVNRENMVSKARAMREFVEQRLNETIHDLAASEEAYKNFQQIHFAISLDEQMKAIINAMAELRGQLVVAEIELGVMKKSLSPTNARYQEQLYKIDEINNQLAKLEKGDSTNSKASILNLPVKDTPELALELARLTRDLKIQETIFELLRQQYEQAKIQEMKDTPTIQVLDRADVPMIKSRPKRVMTAAMGGLVSFSFTLFFVIMFEFVRQEKAKNSAAYKKMENITKMVNDDFCWLRNIFSRRRNNDS